MRQKITERKREVSLVDEEPDKMFNVVDPITHTHLRRVNLEKTKKSITTSYGPETVSVKVATHQCCSGQIRRRLQCVQYKCTM